MINGIVPADQLVAEAERMAARLCELGPTAVQGMKESMIKVASLDYAAINNITEDAQNRVMNSSDRKEGGWAFVEKRQASWS